MRGAEMPNLFDHLLAAVLVVALPLYAKFVWYPKLQRALAASQPDARMKAYRETMVEQWCLAGAAVLAWYYAERPLGELGLAAPTGWRFGISLGLALVGGFLLVRQQRLVAQHKETQEQIRSQLRGVEALLPHSRREFRFFALLSVTAGICEELLFRGFLIWYLAVFSGTAVAVLLSSVLFGLGHAYLGRLHIVRAGAVGLLFAALYILTGSLWVPMLLHALVDISSGQAAVTVLRTETLAKETAD